MGQNLGVLLNHPLTGLAVSLGSLWLQNLSSPKDKVIGEQLLLQTLKNSTMNFNTNDLKTIMPSQGSYIDKMNELQDTIAALEKALDRKGQESFKKVKREFDSQLKKNFKIETYFMGSPGRGVKIPGEYKTSAKSAAAENGIDRENYFNFAFVGHTNNGKSSLINAIFGLNKNDEGAAPVDILECTHDIKYYTHASMPNVRFYDIPGAGTMTHRSENYYEDKALCGFDCLIVLVQQALGQEDIAFAQAALRYDQKVVFVRSKCDVDFHLRHESGNILRHIPSPEEVHQHLENLRHHFSLELERHAPELSSIECFFVSANSLRAIMRFEPVDMLFEEKQFLEYLYQQSKSARGMY
uniref:IRG-type G domain-containing protein n=1 Tax=Panagrolaimus davidi TaxID=227884 RepID=A0A914P049_9BILA